MVMGITEDHSTQGLSAVPGTSYELHKVHMWTNAWKRIGKDIQQTASSIIPGECTQRGRLQFFTLHVSGLLLLF